jgi:predicted nucleotidyltransferase
MFGNVESDLIKTVLSEVTSAMKELYGSKLKEIVLYGSYAKDEQDEESDIDIMLLIDMNDEELKSYDKKLNSIISDIGYKYMKVISVIDMSYKKFNNWANVVPFYKNVANEGVVLYG